MFDFIAIDWGSIRTGIALGSTQSELAIPYSKPLFTKEVIDIVEVLMQKHNFTTIVIGRPTNFKLGPTIVTKKIEEFATLLSTIYPLKEIIFVNENSTSKQGIGLKDKHQINHLAALEIANRFIDSIKK
jgi:RNase H-fold protein (predicted Holliday junction resolvase)